MLDLNKRDHMSIYMVMNICRNKPEVVINSSLVTEGNEAKFYEFILDIDMEVVECGYVSSLPKGITKPINNLPKNLHGMLFELNHVRVNPRLNNTEILVRLSVELENSGVHILNPPTSDLMAVCFKPLGELSDIVRFYLDSSNHLVFLSSSVKLKAV